MATAFYPTPNDTGTTTTGYVAGSGQIALAAGGGAMFGTVFPMVLTLRTADNARRTIYEVTGRTGDLLTGVVVEWGTDADYPAGSPIEVLWCDECVQEIRVAINGVETALPTKAPLVHVHAGADITSGVVAPARLGSGTPSSSNYLRGDGSWQTVATGGGGAVTSVAGKTGDVLLVEADIANLVTDLAAKALLVHVHAGTDITTGTVAAARLGSGAPSSSNYLRGDGQWQAVASATTITGNIPESQVTNLVSDLAGKAPSVHQHAGTDITSGIIAPARLGTGTPSSANYLRGDGSWQATSGATFPGGTTGQVQFNNAGAFGGAALLVYATSGTIAGVAAGIATDTPLVVHGAASQSQNLTEWQTSGGAMVAAIDAAGNLAVGGKNGQLIGGTTENDPNGLVNGIVLRPWLATQDLGLTAGVGVSGLAHGPTILVKPDGLVAVGMNDALLPVGQVNVMPTAHGLRSIVVQSPAQMSRTVTNVACTANVATLVVSAAHTLIVGSTVLVVGLANSWLNGTWTVTGIPSPTTFTFAVTHANLGSTADAGTVTADHTGSVMEWRSPMGNAMGTIAGTDGSLYTWAANWTFSPLDTPAAPTVTPVGTSGGTTYSYKVAAVNAQGDTVASAAGTTTVGNAALSSTNYNHVSWPHVLGATSYRLYGRTAGNEQLITTKQDNQHDDKGVVTPTGLPPAAPPGGKITIRKWTSQTNNLMEWQASSGGRIGFIDKDGMIGLLTVLVAPTQSSADGAMCIDMTNNRLYVRCNGVWRYAQLT